MLAKSCELGTVALLKKNFLLKVSLLRLLLSPFQNEHASDSPASPLFGYKLPLAAQAFMSQSQ